MMVNSWAQLLESAACDGMIDSIMAEFQLVFGQPGSTECREGIIISSERSGTGTF